jgi:hypothetical protein
MNRLSNFADMDLQDRAELELETATEGARKRWAEIEAAIARAPSVIEDETQAENFTTVVAQIQALLVRVDAAHDDVKGPYLAAGRFVDAATNILRSRIEDRKVELELRITAYQVRKQQKIAAQRLAEREREAADPEPAFIPHREVDRKRARVRSLEGATAHLVDTTDIEIVDVTKIPPRYLNRPKVLAALRSEILPDVRKGDQVEGVKKIDGVQTRVKA